MYTIDSGRSQGLQDSESYSSERELRGNCYPAQGMFIFQISITSSHIRSLSSIIRDRLSGFCRNSSFSQFYILATVPCFALTACSGIISPYLTPPTSSASPELLVSGEPTPRLARSPRLPILVFRSHLLGSTMYDNSRRQQMVFKFSSLEAQRFTANPAAFYLASC